MLAAPPAKVEVDPHYPATCETIGSSYMCPSSPDPDFRIATLVFSSSAMPALARDGVAQLRRLFVFQCCFLQRDHRFVDTPRMRP